MTFNQTFIREGQSGRLYAEAAIIPAQSEFIQFKITSRLRISEDQTPEGQLQAAHDWLIEMFLALTNDDVRKQRWGQE